MIAPVAAGVLDKFLVRGPVLSRDIDRQTGIAADELGEVKIALVDDKGLSVPTQSHGVATLHHRLAIRTRTAIVES